MRRECHDRVDDRRRRTKLLGISAHFLFPRLPFQLEGSLRTDVGVRLFVREVRRRAFRGLHFHFLAGFDLDQRFRRRFILLVGLQPDGASQNLGVVVDRHGFTWSAALFLTRAHLMCVVQVVAARTHRNFQPTVAIFTAVQQRPVGARNFRALGIGDGIAHVVRWRILRAQCLKRAVQLRLHRCQQRRSLGRRIRRRSLRDAYAHRSQQRQQTQRRTHGKHSIPNRFAQSNPHLLLDGSTNHSVYDSS